MIRTHNPERILNMNILVGIHINGDYTPDSELNCVNIILDDAAIKDIFKISNKAVKAKGTISQFDYRPKLGKTFVDAIAHETEPYIDVDKTDLSDMMGDNEIFFELPQVRSDVIQLHVNDTDFWWEGMFKHTYVHWETRMIPLAFLPQELRPPARHQSGKSQTALTRPEVELTAAGIDALLEKISRGIAQGLNSREIDDQFNRHVTKAQLIRCITHLLEKGN